MIEEVTVGRWTPWCYYLCPVFLQGVLIMAKSSWIRSKKLALGIAVALGCSLMSVTSAEQTEADFMAPITGDIEKDVAYSGILEVPSKNNNVYTFTKDSSITVDGAAIPFTIQDLNSKDYNVQAAAVNMVQGKTSPNICIAVPANKLTLSVKASGDNIGAGILQTTGLGTLQFGSSNYGAIKELNINVNADADNTKKSYGIWRAATDNKTRTITLTATDGLNIKVDNPNGAYGIAVSTPEGMTTDNKFYNNSGITVNGDVNITVSGNKKAADVLENSAGLFVDSNHAKITLNHKGNIVSDGNGIVVAPVHNTPNYNNQAITVKKGGTIKLIPADDGSERYAIYNTYGKVFYGANSVGGLNSQTGAVVLGTGTQIGGDVFVGDNEKNIVYLGLSGNDSYLNGVIKEDGKFGNVLMILNDGAVWNNTAANAGNKGTNTVLNNFSGINGMLHQSADSGDVTIKKFDSHLFNVAYEHDKKDPSKILGGNFTIEKAIENSALNVFTDYDANLNTEAAREATLNALANKIYYTGYASGERNLNGTVSIAEGLTTSSASKYFADMSFDDTTGQGYLGKESKVNEYVKPAEQGAVEFTKAIIGDVSLTKEYQDAGVYDNGNYVFTKDIKINVDPEGNKLVAGPWLYTFSSGIFSGYNQQNVNVDLNGHSMDLNIATDQSTTGIAAVGATGKVEIFNAGAMSVKAVSNEGAQTAALFVNGGGQLYIHNGGENLEKKVLTVRGSTTNSTNGAVIKSMNGANGERSWLKVDGLIDLEADTTDGVGMAEGLSAVASTIDVGVGRIIMTKAGQNPGLNFGGGAENAAIRAYGEFVTQNYGIVNVNVIKDEDSPTGNAIAAGNNTTQIVGNFTTVGGMGTKGKINVGLNTPDSYWVGNFVTGGGWGVTPGDYGIVSLFMGNKAKWMGKASYATKLLMDSGATWEGYSLNNAVDATIKNGAVWYNINDTEEHTKLKSLIGGATEAAAGTVDMTHDGVVDTTIEQFGGHVNVIYKHAADDATNILGGNFTINHAAEGSAITLTTDNSGFDVHKADETKAVLSSLANKLYYQGAVDNAETNLDGYVQIAEGLTAASAGMKLADVEFSADNGQASLVADTIRTPDAKIIYGSSETAMMKGAKSAMASGALMWRAENNDLLKRMGDLRLDDGDAGIWAKYYGGKYEMDSQNTDLNLKYNAYQVGFDKAVGNGWSVGLAVSYNDGDSNYGSGKADLKDTSVGLYGTWKGNDGQYVDLIAKYTRMENDYDVANVYGHKLSGDYKTWGTSISAEYGKRFENDNGFYFDPSVELTLGRINGKDYSANSDYLDTWGKSRGMQVQQDAFNTLVGRVGFRLGQQTEKASYFVKLAAAHEFKGEFNSRFAAEGESEGRTSIDFGDTWYEAQIGGTAKLSKNSLIYADFERSFGGDVEEKWRVDAGLRFTF